MSSHDFIVIICIAVYLLPTIVASLRGKKPGEGGVFFVNLLLGWTVIGWFVAFIWACSGTTKRDIKRQEQQHAELLEALTKSQQVRS